MTTGEDLLLRIGAAAVEVDRLRVRQAAAKRARNKIRCRHEGNEIDPCWKQWREVPRYMDAPDMVRIPLEEQCSACRCRYTRQRAFAAESKRLAGARRRVTILARGYRTKAERTR